MTCGICTPPTYCEDLPGWYDSQGPKYHCQYYADRENCLNYGYTHKKFGHAAITACCTCGGGITNNRSTVKVDVKITLSLSNLVPIEDEATRISILEALRRDFKHIVPHGSTVTGVEIAQSSSADHDRKIIRFQGSAGEGEAAPPDPQDGSMTIHATQSVNCDDINTCNEDQIGSGVEQEHNEEISKARRNGSLPGALASQFRLQNLQAPQVNGVRKIFVSSDSQQVVSYWNSLNQVTQKGISGAAEAAQYGYALAQNGKYRGLLPYSGNQGRTPIFNPNAYATYVERTLFADTEAVSFTISETSMTEYSKKLSTAVSITGSGYAEFLGGTVRASAAHSIDATTQQQSETYFTDFRIEYTFATSQIPLDGRGALSEADVKELVLPSTLSDLQGLQDLPITSQGQISDQYVANMGIAFVRKVSFGGSFEMSCKVIAQSWMNSEVVKDAVEVSYTSLMGSASAAISLSHSVNITSGGKHSSSTFKTLFRGGDFAVYKDQEAWRQSVEKTPILLTYELVPIYELIRPDDKKYNASRNILIAAVNRAVKKFDGDIPNYTSVPSIVLLPARKSGNRYGLNDPTYTADPPAGYALFGSGYTKDKLIPAVKIDGVHAKLNTGWKYVWDDHDDGWEGRLAIWLPTSDDSDYVACGYTSFDSYEDPPYRVAMLNTAVTGTIYPDFPTIGVYPLWRQVGWPNFNGANVWEPNLFYNNDNAVYAPRWDIFNQSQA